MGPSIGIVILAGGEGKRLKMSIPKPMAPIAGITMIDFSMNAATQFIANNGLKGAISVVTGYQHELLDSYLSNYYGNLKEVEFSLALQREQKGTAHALQMYLEQNKKSSLYDYTVVMCADTPLIRESHLSHLWDVLKRNQLSAVAATYIEQNPHGYGRIIHGNPGFHIVEDRDADQQVKSITEVNSGLYMMKTSFLLEKIKKIQSLNKANEFYLTDIFQDNFNVRAVMFEDAKRFMGVNNVDQLEVAQSLVFMEKVDDLKRKGVRFMDSRTNYIDVNVQVSPSTYIHPNVILQGDTFIGAECVVGAGSIIQDSTIEDGVILKPYSVLENAVVRKKAVLGPFVRIRPESDIGENCKVGNFVEIKKTMLEGGVKISHLSYVGDARIGENTNIGCGFITCNYDGTNKNFTDIGKNCFIGSDTQMIAPVKVEDDCYVGSGSTINKSMPQGTFAVARSKQVNYENMAHKFIKKKKL